MDADFWTKAFNTLAGAGVAGIVLAFYLIKICPCIDAFKLDMGTKLARLEEALDRSTKADLLRLIASPHISDAVKDAAAGVIQSVDTATGVRSLDEKKAP